MVASAAGFGLVFASLAWTPAVRGEIEAGPLAYKFSLTLSPGGRTEVLGPLFNRQNSDGESEFAVPPLFSYTKNPSVESKEFDFLYPLLTYDRFGAEYRLQLIQMLSFSGGQDQSPIPTRRFTLFPFYFQQRSADTNENYTALLPFYGTLKHRLMRDEIHFVMIPLYLESRKKDVVTDNYLLPFFHLRHGNGLKGWQFWPLIGHEQKAITTRTNSVGDLETVGGYDKWFGLWPIYFHENDGIGTDNPGKTRILLPFYSSQSSPQRDSTSYLWPFFTITDDRARKYREWDMPWPLIVFARGEGKTANRIWPLFSQAHTTNQATQFYLWPLYRRSQFHSDTLESDRTQILFFLYSDLTDKVPGDKIPLRRTDFWPLFTARRERNGDERLQLFAPLEPILPRNKSIERNYSPIWSIWRSEKNAKAGASSQSFLWNLYRFEKDPQRRKCSLLFGLFQYQSGSEGRRWRLFYIPFGKLKENSAPAPVQKS